MHISAVKAWSMWALVSFFYAYQYVLRVLLNILMPDLINYFGINAKEFGQFAGMYYIAYAAAHIPLGLLLDRRNPKIIIPACILLTAFGTAMQVSNSIVMAYIGRFLMGIGSSGAILGAFKVIRIGFPETHFNRMLGLCVMVGLLGALYGGLPLSLLVQSMSWQATITMLCWVGVGLAIFTYLIIPSKYVPIKGVRHAMHDVRQVLTNKYVLIICISGGLMIGPLEGFADVWGAGFLQKVYNILPENAAGMTSLIFLGMCFGAPGLTYLADRLQAHLKIILLCGLCMMAAFVVMLLGWGGSTTTLSALFVLIGVCCAYQIIAIYLASTYVRESLVGLTTAIANMIMMTFGYVFHSSIGITMGNHQADGTFLAEQYLFGLAVIPIGLGLAFLGFSWLQQQKIETC